MKKFFATLILIVVSFAFGVLATILINFLGFKAMALILTTMSLIILSLALMTSIILMVQWAINTLWPPKQKY